MGKEDFKEFVRRNPHFVDYVKNNKMTWQQFYEIYDLYGENNSIWDSFKKEENNPNIVSTVKEFMGLFKGIDLKSIQKNIVSLDKTNEDFKGFNTEKDNTSYEERPKYKYFED